MPALSPTSRVTPFAATATALLFALVLGGCATHSAYSDDSDDPPASRSRSETSSFVRTAYGTVSGFWIPALKVKADKDESEPNQGLELEADLRTGPGWGVRLGVERRPVGVGLVYLNSRHREREARTHADAHQLFVELHGGTFMSRVHPLGLRLAFGLGVGGVVIDFEDRFDDTGSAAGMIRGEIGYTLYRHVDLTVGGAGFLWGYPGETFGYGGFVSAGGTVRF